MGLPLFYTPTEAEENARAAEKTAARSRSTIRRHFTTTNPNGLTRHYTLSNEEIGAFTLASDPDGSADAESPEEAEATALRRRPFLWEDGERWIERRPRHGPWLRTATASGGNESGPVSGRALRVARESYGLSSHPHTLSSGSRERTSDQAVIPPSAESGDLRSNRAILERSARYFRTEQRAEQQRQREFTSSTVFGIGSSGQLPAYTPDFPPARRHVREGLRRRSASPRARSRSHDAAEAELERSYSVSRQNGRSLRGFPPLRRMGHRSVAERESGRRSGLRTRLDGLGDRDRSLSPEGDGAWETMLTTLTPDPQLPSAGSSFVSSSATASSASMTESSGTSLTSISRGNPPESMAFGIDGACDILDGSDDSSDTSMDSDDESLYNAAIGNSSWYAYGDTIANTEEAARRSGATPRESLGGLRRIVRGLASREDIPDEWWAEAGLSRTLPHDRTTS